ncbi:sigma-70 family RNA polymerase sigma factor [Paenibacillus methanolicus]|uniref:RNA polymerase sigma-70 factor (ECF subfamily) n=1 Tax=Paenibacillus methanolicus TaxID=582686 RepID=A0A5S5C882_9BACL|nr:sigma-70 family RNA polymerase sigma factor [Paenibacillus methanolicus]TYP74596.1 RNA polymerase sigma-70 factor (ECF subfamily) [Paenibacillus methanolicus]
MREVRTLLEAAEVVARLREKDESALRYVMDRYGDNLLRTAYLLVKDRQAAEEAVQDTFLQAFRKIAQLNHPDQLHAWLVRIVVNRCRMQQRTWSWRHIFPTLGEKRLLLESDEPGPEEMFFDQWQSGSVSHAIHQLAYNYREVITLYYYHEMPIAEISGQLALNLNTVKARLARGRAQLKDILNREQEARP